MGFLAQLWRQLRAIYEGMSRPRRIGLAVLAVACVAGVIAVVMWAVQADYRVLYTGLAAEDAGAVTAKLQARGVPFRLGAGGTTILVPAEQVAQLRLDLAVEGLPAKSKGFELFDEVNIGMTPFQQHVNYDRALQAELAKTIMQVEPVLFARVHLVRPESSPFVRDQKPATASVVLKLKPGTTLSRKTAAGITALVARSVEGLTPAQVTLLDTAGRLLTEPTAADSTGPASSQLDYRRDMEAYLSARAEEMLARVLGPGRAVVRVTADVNFRHQKTRRESYDPDQRVLVKETITNRKAASGAPGARGVAGAGSNLPGNKTATSTSVAGSDENEENTDSEWRATKIEQELEEGHGTVERLTVAALLDLSRPEVATGAALTVAEAEEIVKQAVGFKKGRDEIKVSNVKLAGSTAPDEPGAADIDRWSWYLALARNASLGIFALVVLILGLLHYRRLRVARRAEPETASQEPADRLAELARQDPDGLVRVLTAWLDEAPGTAAESARRAA